MDERLLVSVWMEEKCSADRFRSPSEVMERFVARSAGKDRSDNCSRVHQMCVIAPGLNTITPLPVSGCFGCLAQDAAEPVHMVVSESWIVYSYWSASSHRTEISTLSLYEGMIDKYGLSPLNRVSA